MILLTTDKLDELQQLLGEVAAVNLGALMGESRAQQKQRQKEREQKRKELKEQGMSEEEITKMEDADDEQGEQTALKTSTGNALQDLEVCGSYGDISF